jgi:hypothetical protein
MPVGKGQFASLLKPDLYRVYLETGKERPLEYEKFFNVVDMPWSIVDDRQISGLGTLASMNEGDQFTLDEPNLGGTKQYEAEIFGLAVEITYPMWKDDQYGVMRDIVREEAHASRNKQEVEAWSVLNNAFDTSFTGFDGLSLCNTAHTLLDGAGTTIANRPSPDVGLSTLAVQNSLIRFENMVDERNLPRLLTPSMCLVSPTNKYLAREVLGSAGKPFTADNEQNAILQDDLRWMIVHYFTNATQWFLAAAQGQHDLQFMWRDRPIFDVFDDPWTKNAVATVWQRHTKGFGAWRGIDGSQP